MVSIPVLDLPRYWLAQGARVGWFLGQYLAGFALTGAVTPRPTRPAPRLAGLLADLANLLREDSANIASGVYKRPRDVVKPPAAWLADALRYFDDLPEVNARRRRRGADELPANAARAGLPDYYRRNFHYQTDGYLSEHSARLYDQQVEVLFIGGADAMRRQALVPIAAWTRRRRRRPGVILDVACGTGRFLAALADNYPDARLIGLDLSRPYLEETARYVGDNASVDLLEGLAEKMPLKAASVDIITMIYLLHEVPSEVRRQIAGECARVLRPGGRLIIVDSFQYGDEAGFDGLIENFPVAFHEPYYADYAREDLNTVFAAAGFTPGGSRRAFLSKVFVFDRR
jgi:ubiquinone/menaquinone biosynthesis C-methylase UbiE